MQGLSPLQKKKGLVGKGLACHIQMKKNLDALLDTQHDPQLLIHGKLYIGHHDNLMGPPSHGRIMQGSRHVSPMPQWEGHV